MKKITFSISFLGFFLSLFIVSESLLAQSFSHQNSVMLDALIVNANTAIQLSWESDASASQYSLFRRDYGAASWGTLVTTLPGSSTTYLDNTVIVGQKYEYRIIRNSTATGYGYICAGVDTEIDHDPGVLLLVIDDYFLPTLQPQINQLVVDIESDGWFVHILEVSRTQAVSQVKSLISAEYNTDPQRVKGVFLLGHVPVPYSGDMNPDGHPDHLGAWPADVYYADMDGAWTDNTVDNATASSPRNHNIPGDGKFDQYFVNTAELEVTRVDFYDLPVFSQTETELMAAYLNKLHEFKTHLYVPTDAALVEDNFLGLDEGFAAGGYMSFSPIVGRANVADGDYASTLVAQDHLWSYGTGPGSYTDAQGIISAGEFASNDLNSTFTMLFGSYFGDWDSQNNLLRSALASGRILCSSWSGRPNLFYHPMGLGENIGSCIRLSQNNTSAYFGSTTSYFKRWVHIAQMGDGTLRAHYLDMPSNLLASGQMDGSVQLSWTAPVAGVDGYYIYRRGIGTESWSKLNTLPVTATSYTDVALINGGQYEYMVRSVQLLTTGSGRYRNQSLGIKGTANSVASLATIEAPSFGPNPFEEELKISSSNSQIAITNALGQIMYRSKDNANVTINTINWPKGLYFLSSDQTTYRIIKR